WHASRTGDPARRFVYNYQILEYMAHYIVEDDIRARMRKLLLSPHVLEDVNSLVDDMFDTASASKIHDSQKVGMLLERVVDPRMIWHEVRRNISLFDKPTVFDNEFSVGPLAKTNWTADDFAASWASPFANAIRSIRNGLSHA